MSAPSSKNGRRDDTREAAGADPVKVDRDRYEGRQFRALLAARNNLLAIWTASAYRDRNFEFRFLGQHYFVCNAPELVRHVFLGAHDNYDRKSPQMRHAFEPDPGEPEIRVRELADALGRKLDEMIGERIEQWYWLPGLDPDQRLSAAQYSAETTPARR